MTDVKTELRESLAEELWADVHRQSDGRWPVDLGGQQLEGAVDAEIDFLALADRALSMPAIREALEIAGNLQLNQELQRKRFGAWSTLNP